MTSLLEIPLKEKSWEKILDFKNQTLDFLEQHQAILKASLLVFIAIIFFVGIAFPETIQTHFFSRQRWFGLTSVILYLLFSLIFVLLTKWSWFQSIAVLVQSNLLMLFSFAYFLRLNFREIIIGEFSFHTSLLSIPLALLIFLVNYRLFQDSSRVPFWLIIPQVLLFALQAFSVLSFTDSFLFSRVNFSSDWLNLLFNIHPFVWLTLAGLAIAVISVFSYNLEKLSDFWKIMAIFGFLIIQTMVFVYLIQFADLALKLTYWHLTLLTLIVWDWLYNSLFIIAKKIPDPRFYVRLTVSTIYHLILLLIVLLIPQFM